MDGLFQSGEKGLMVYRFGKFFRACEYNENELRCQDKYGGIRESIDVPPEVRCHNP